MHAISRNILLLSLLHDVIYIYSVGCAQFTVGVCLSLFLSHLPSDFTDIHSQYSHTHTHTYTVRTWRLQGHCLYLCGSFFRHIHRYFIPKPEVIVCREIGFRSNKDVLQHDSTEIFWMVNISFAYLFNRNWFRIFPAEVKIYIFHTLNINIHISI